MNVLQLTTELKTRAINTPMVHMSSYGDIQNYNHKASIWYPLVNFDVLSERVTRGEVRYRVRVYVVDRNPEEYISYNKTSLILKNILKHPQLEVEEYTANYFRMDFLDQSHGVWTDVEISRPVVMECYTEEDTEGGRVQLEDNSGFVITEEGDYVKKEDYDTLLPVEDETLL